MLNKTPVPLKSTKQKQKSSRQQTGQKKVVFFSARLVRIFDGTSPFQPFHELSLITCLGSLCISYPDHIQKTSTKKFGKLECMQRLSEFPPLAGHAAKVSAMDWWSTHLRLLEGRKWHGPTDETNLFRIGQENITALCLAKATSRR